MPAAPAQQDEDLAHDNKYVLDASVHGSVARFVNHSCEPNLFIQPVLTHHRDKDMPRVCLFSMETIPAMTELTCAARSMLRFRLKSAVLCLIGGVLGDVCVGVRLRRPPARCGLAARRRRYDYGPQYVERRLQGECKCGAAACIGDKLKARKGKGGGAGPA